MSNILESDNVTLLSNAVEEAARSTVETVKFFVEPAQGTLNRATSKRHHILFGRRGSGKTSLLRKVAQDLTVSRTPIAFVDLEEFKGHSYPDVLLSILLRTFAGYKEWLETAAVEPANKKKFWDKVFGQAPSKSAFNKKEAKKFADEFLGVIKDLNDLLIAPDKFDAQDTQSTKGEEHTEAAVESRLEVGIPSAKSSVKGNAAKGSRKSHQLETLVTYSGKKHEALTRNIIQYKDLISRVAKFAGGNAYLLLDDLYHLQLGDQAPVLDYFHRIAKGSNLWLKIGTIRNRSKWYLPGRPPIGMKLGDDADEIDLDVTLEKYDSTKKFLFRILKQFADETEIELDDLITVGAKDRLVLASGGVARDFLTIFRGSIDIARERVAGGNVARGTRIGAEDINVAAGNYDRFKREDFDEDSIEGDQERLLNEFESISNFCLNEQQANCFLVNKRVSNPQVSTIRELMDFKFLHLVRSRVTVRNRGGELYDAYMLDLSQYSGERKRRNLKIITFWGQEAADSLRKSNLVYIDL